LINEYVVCTHPISTVTIRTYFCILFDNMVDQFAVNDFQNIFFLKIEVISILLLQYIILLIVSSSLTIEMFLSLSSSVGSMHFLDIDSSICSVKESLYIAFIFEHVLVISVSQTTMFFRRVLKLAHDLFFAHLTDPIQSTHYYIKLFFI